MEDSGIGTAADAGVAALRVFLPSVPNFVRLGCAGESSDTIQARAMIPVGMLSDDELRDLGQRWTEALIRNANLQGRATTPDKPESKSRARMRMTADRIAELRGPLERRSAEDISPAWSARLLEAFDEIELLRAPTRAPEEGRAAVVEEGDGLLALAARWVRNGQQAADHGLSQAATAYYECARNLADLVPTPDSEVSEPSK